MSAKFTRRANAEFVRWVFVHGIALMVSSDFVVY